MEDCKTDSCEMKEILILSGGGGSEHEVSINSCVSIYNALQQEADFTVRMLQIDARGRWLDRHGTRCELLSTGELLTAGETVHIDYVIPYMMGYPGETGHIQAKLEMIGLPYYGCSAEASLYCYNKVVQKQLTSMIGVPQCDYICLYKRQESYMSDAYKFFDKYNDVIVKPANEGSSIGVGRATTHVQLEARVSAAFQYGAVIIVERTITDAKEYLVSVAEIGGQLIIPDPIAVDVKSDIFDQESKYNDTGRYQYELDPVLSPETLATVKQYARKLFRHFQLRHLSRIDFFITASDEVYLIEINTLPGMVNGSSTYPMSMEKAGYPLRSIFTSIIREQFQ